MLGPRSVAPLDDRSNPFQSVNNEDSRRTTRSTSQVAGGKPGLPLYEALGSGQQKISACPYKEIEGRKYPDLILNHI